MVRYPLVKDQTGVKPYTFGAGVLTPYLLAPRLKPRPMEQAQLSNVYNCIWGGLGDELIG